MGFKYKKFLLVICLFLSVIFFSKSFLINKLPLKLLNNSIVYLDDKEEIGYKIIRLSDIVETVKYEIYNRLNSFGMVLKYEKEIESFCFNKDLCPKLNGSEVIHHLLGEPYIDEGCSIYDKNGNKIAERLCEEIYNDVDVNKEGAYSVVYVGGGDEEDASQELITRSVYVSSRLSSPRCEGIINRYGTTLTYSSYDFMVGNDMYEEPVCMWEIDGITIDNKGSCKMELKYKKVDSASVIFYNGEKINCNIKNSLIYDFKYDSENEKPYIGCRTYDSDDKTRLESILKNAVNEAGYGTRAGVVEAARFLVGGLDYKVKYMGPKQEHWQIGTYPYVGLNINAYTGWGCTIKGYIQGMDCTNFTGWAFKQNGLKVDNVYSTKNVYPLVDVVDKLQVGDLLLTPNDTSFSHVGIVIGIDDSSIYVAEATTTDKINAIVTTRLDKNNLPTKGRLSRARLYEYEKEGNVTNMWVS